MVKEAQYQFEDDYKLIDHLKRNNIPFALPKQTKSKLQKLMVVTKARKDDNSIEQTDFHSMCDQSEFNQHQLYQNRKQDKNLTIRGFFFGAYQYARVRI